MSRRRHPLGITMAVGASLAVAVSLAPVSSAGAGAATREATSRRLSVGIGSNYQWSGNLQIASKDLPKLKRDGITSIREDILWNVVQPDSPRQWRWQQYDQLFTTMSKLRMQVLAIIGYGTTWASPGGQLSNIPTGRSGQLAYARFAAAVVRRYGPHGSFWASHGSIRTPEPIHAVELWNEPWYAPHPSVQNYIAIVRDAGAAVHRVSSSVLTAANVDDRWTHISGSTPLWGQAVLRQARSLAPYVDRWAIHPYSEGQWTGASPAADSIRQLTWVQQQLRAAHCDKPIWVSEIGYSTARPPRSSKGFHSYTPPQQAYRAFLTAATRTTGPNRVTGVWIFTSSRPTSATKPGSWDYGFNLISRNGVVSSAVRSAVRAAEDR